MKLRKYCVDWQDGVDETWHNAGLFRATSPRSAIVQFVTVYKGTVFAVRANPIDV